MEGERGERERGRGGERGGRQRERGRREEGETYSDGFLQTLDGSLVVSGQVERAGLGTHALDTGGVRGQ